MTRKLLVYSWTFPNVLKAAAFFLVLQNVSTTDVEEASSVTYTSFEYPVDLPTLFCNTKSTGYNVVWWYKDDVIVKSSAADLAGHQLSLVSLLNQQFLSFSNNPLKLQGYYWCETDSNSSHTSPNKFLFRIPDVRTYFGILTATKDSLKEDSEPVSINRIWEKTKQYENEFQTKVFSFLSQPYTFVTNVKDTKNGLEVTFLLYVGKQLLPRFPRYQLEEDEQQLEDIIDHLNNKTLIDDQYLEVLNHWLEDRGISVDDIILRSTAGCYPEMTPTSGEALEVLTWSYALLGEIAVSEESCSTEHGLAVTRTCQGTFTTGAAWGTVDGKCVFKPDELTTELKSLSLSLRQQDYIEIIRKLKLLTSNPELLGIIDLHIITSIVQDLSTISNIDDNELNDIFFAVNSLLEANQTVLDDAKNTLRISNRVMNVVENIIESINNEGKAFNVAKSSILLNTTLTQQREEIVIGFKIISFVGNSLENSSVKVVINGSHYPSSLSKAGFILPNELILEREEGSLFPSKLNVVLFKDWRLFSDPKLILKQRNFEVLQTPVIHVSLSGGPAWNLSHPVVLFFKDEFQTEIEHPMCVYFDKKLNDNFGDWSTEGCSFEGLKDGHYICHCYHLSTFAVILSQQPSVKFVFKMNYSIYVGGGLSIAALTLTVLVFAFSSTWHTKIDHFNLFFLALAFLFCMIVLLVNNVKSHLEPGCTLNTMIFYYFIFVTFCWLLVQSIVHHMRFARKNDVEDMPSFLLKASAFSWCLPLLIVAIMWIINGSKYTLHQTCWPTVAEISKMAFIPVLILLFLTMCINASAAYAITCHFKKDLTIGCTNYKEAALKFRVSISIFVLFVLSWIFGYLALHNKPVVLQVLFSISITVTAIYIFLYFLFQDLSPRELWGKFKAKRSKRSESSSTNASADNLTIDELKSYNSTK